MSKRYTQDEMTQAIRETLMKLAQDKLESLEKSDKSEKNKVEEVHLDSEQKVFVTKENESGLPEATDKQKVAEDQLGVDAVKKADPAGKTSGQMQGLKLPSQPKPPAATPKPIANAKAGMIESPKKSAAGSIPKAPTAGGAQKLSISAKVGMPKLGMGLKKFMDERGERLAKAHIDSGKTDKEKRDARFERNAPLKHGSPETRQLKGVHKPIGGKASGNSDMGLHSNPDSQKRLASDKLKEIKKMPKPDLGKGEE